MAILTRNQSWRVLAMYRMRWALPLTCRGHTKEGNTRGRLQENISLELPKKDSMFDLGN